MLKQALVYFEPRDTVFIIHGTDQIVPPFGTYAYYDHEAEKKKAA